MEEASVINSSKLAKFIYGKMLKNHLPVNSEIAQDIEQIALDYFIGKPFIEDVIISASYKYKYNNDFDYISFIHYGLINSGKEKGARGKKRYV